MLPVTTVVVTDPELLAKLASSDNLIVFKGLQRTQRRVCAPRRAGSARSIAGRVQVADFRRGI
jgi:hypothetical protein